MPGSTQVAPTSPKRLRGSPEGVDAAPTKLSDEAGVGRVDVVASILDHLSNRTYGREPWFPPTSHLRGLNFSVLRQGKVRRIYLLRGWVNKGKSKARAARPWPVAS